MIMKLIIPVLISLFLLRVVDSSSSSSSVNNSSSIITKGSSLSWDESSTAYWISPSGNIAFGFYQLPYPPEYGYVVGIGIWFVKSPQRTLVWAADLALQKPASIIFNNQGEFVLRINNEEQSLLPDVTEPAEYAVMHDNGNFVLYGGKDQIVWQSFDYPTHTILGGQMLRPGIDLVSGGNYGSHVKKRSSRLSVHETNGLVKIYAKTSIDLDRDGADELSAVLPTVISGAIQGSGITTPAMLKLDTAGNMYLVGSDGVILKYLYKQQDEYAKEDPAHVYRATLDSTGDFNLYKERIDEESSSTLVWSWEVYHLSFVLLCLIPVFVLVAFVLLCALVVKCICCICCCC